MIAAAFVLMLAGAAVQDVRSRTISNAWPLAFMLLFAVAWAMGAITGSLGSHLLHFGIVLLVGILVFALDWVGGGDAKLYAAVALWFALEDGLFLFLSIALSGAVLAIVHLTLALIGNRAESRRKSLRERKLAYGVAIAVGAIIALPRAFA